MTIGLPAGVPQATNTKNNYDGIVSSIGSFLAARKTEQANVLVPVTRPHLQDTKREYRNNGRCLANYWGDNENRGAIACMTKRYGTEYEVFIVNMKPSALQKNTDGQYKITYLSW
jgi:hypothetical protein